VQERERERERNIRRMQIAEVYRRVFGRFERFFKSSRRCSDDLYCRFYYQRESALARRNDFDLIIEERRAN